MPQRKSRRNQTRQREGVGEPGDPRPLPDDGDFPDDACCRSRRKARIPYLKGLALIAPLMRQPRESRGSAFARLRLFRCAPLEVKRRAVDAIAQPRRPGAIGEDMAEMAFA